MLLKYYILFLIVFTLFVIIFSNKEDFVGLPNDNFDRIISIIYYIINTFTTVGSSGIYANSIRAKIIISLFMLINFSFLIIICQYKILLI
jgi:hypothetical protein